MGNEIAYLMGSYAHQIQNLGKGALPPYNPRQGASPLRTPRSQTSLQDGMMPMHILVKPAQRGRGRAPFLWQSGEMGHSGIFKIGGSMESLVKMVQIENSLRNYVNFTLWNGFSWAFKTLKPWASGGSAPWTPGATMEFQTKIVKTDNSVQNYMWISPPILPSKTVS